jgi:hypothetical protein
MRASFCHWRTLLAKHPGFRIAAVVLTAVGCGGNSADVPDGGASGGSGGTSSTGGSAGSGGNGGVAGGGTGGAAGVSGTGGAGGSGAAGGTGGTGGLTPGDSGTCGCVTGRVGWGMNGGHVAYEDASALETCNRFVHQRTSRAQDPPGVSCEQQITACAGVFTPGDVTRAVEHADVRAAIAAAPVLYGEDPRAYDGAVLRIQVGTAIVEVGTACRAAGCKPVPAGVSTLASLLQAITKQELSRAPCSMVFPPPP